MSAFFKKPISWILALVFAGLVCSCVGINPAGPPAPLAEVPSALTFPDSVAVGVDEVNISGSDAGALRLLEFYQALKPQVMPIGGEFFDAIVYGFDINEFVNTRLEEFLADLSSLQIPLNPVTRFFDTADLLPAVRLKFDFTDFDYDGDGQPEGCTGCTCPTGCDAVCPSETPPETLRPVCFRIWRDAEQSGEFSPYVAGRFDQLNIPDDPATPEDEGNPGEGTFRLSVSLFAFPGEPPVGVTNLGVNYNHRDPDRPLDKFTEYFTLFQTVFFAPDSDLAAIRVEQSALDEVNPSEERLLKTIRYSDNQVNSDGTPVEPPSNLLYSARYRTDFDFWSGSFLDKIQFDEFALLPPPDIDSFTAACAQLSTAVGVDQGACLDIGIDVSNLPFLDLLLPDDPRVNLPADFPAIPTF